MKYNTGYSQFKKNFNIFSRVRANSFNVTRLIKVFF